MPRSFLILFLFLFTSFTFAKEELISSPLAEAFGRQPSAKQLRLSPDGNKIVYIKTHPDGYSYAIVLNTITSGVVPVLGGRKDEYDITECSWANNSRLLCTASLTEYRSGRYIGITRLLGVNDDGSDFKVLVKGKDLNFSQFQSNIIDQLFDDPAHVWLELSEGDGVSVQVLNVYSGRVANAARQRNNVWSWMSNGAGELRLYQEINYSKNQWYFSQGPDSDWKLLKSSKLDDGYSSFAPIGFGADPNKLFYFDNYKGRQGIFVMDLSEAEPEAHKVYTRNDVDLSGVYRLGKSDRIVGVSYELDHTYYHFFDESLAELQAILIRTFPNKGVRILDEDWAKNRYLVLVNSDTDSGGYFIYDKQKNQLIPLGRLYPAIDKLALAPMKPVSYLAKDGEIIPGYLTLPSQGKAPYRTIILPHGGPSSRDVVGFDFLVQYLASKGYAVLQSNYRGSSGYGSAWEGEGAFKQWRLVVSDVLDGAEYLVKEGVADKNNICIVGWSYGGYAAFMSAIENPDIFKCVGSIAGVTDPKDLADYWGGFVGGKASKEFIGMNDEVIIQGSPKKRVEEIQQPVFMVHPSKDLNVPYRQGKAMTKALKKAKKDVEFVQYKYAEHSIRPERYRIDMLTRLGDFLDKHLGSHFPVETR